MHLPRIFFYRAWALTPPPPQHSPPPIPGSEAAVDYYPAKRAKGIALIPGASQVWGRVAGGSLLSHQGYKWYCPPRVRAQANVEHLGTVILWPVTQGVIRASWVSVSKRQMIEDADGQICSGQGVPSLPSLPCFVHACVHSPNHVGEQRSGAWMVGPAGG